MLFMIASLTGSAILASDKHVVLDVRGVGYKVFATQDTIDFAKAAPEAFLFIHTVVREDALDLYGFRDEQSLSLFEKLLGISGIGPRAALAVLSVAPAEALQNAIATSNLAYLTKVSGIGKKTAEKIILELKDKLVSFETSVGQTSDSDTDALLALESLGYSSAQAREALQNVSKETLGTREKIKEALQNMSK